MRVKRLILGMVRTNCYLVTEEETKETFIIDPADEAGTIINTIQEDGLVPKGILLTHGHFDHIYAVKEVAERFRIPVGAGEEEAELLGNPVMNESASVRRECTVYPDILLKDKERLTLGTRVFTVIFTPGHTKGGVCYYCEKEAILFSGDTLFFESVGRTDLHTGNSMQLLKSIRERLFLLGDDITVYPGHGPKTTLSYEKRNNTYLLND
jgi:hydroxyacylglutathione hydrolase